MVTIGVRFDPAELDAFQRRIQSSVRHLGSPQLTRTLEQWGIEANRHDALAGVDRYGRALVPWKVRRGRSDYHGRDYGRFNNPTTLVPFGRSSRRIDAFRISVRRRSVAGIGFGSVTLDAEFDSRAGLIPTYWRRRGRDVLGMSPRTRQGYERLLTRHMRAGHSLLRRGAGRAAAL